MIPVFPTKIWKPTTIRAFYAEKHDDVVTDNIEQAEYECCSYDRGCDQGWTVRGPKQALGVRSAVEPKQRRSGHRTRETTVTAMGMAATKGAGG